MNNVPYLVVGTDSNACRQKAQELAPKALTVNVAKIEDIRQLEKFLQLGYSFILENAQDLTVEAQNALLKVLEELPKNTCFVLIAQHEDQLLETITSRCFLISGGELSKSASTSKDLEMLKSATSRHEALALVDKILLARPSPSLARNLLILKRYLKANCHVKLALETLLESC